MRYGGLCSIFGAEVVLGVSTIAPVVAAPLLGLGYDPSLMMTASLSGYMTMVATEPMMNGTLNACGVGGAAGRRLVVAGQVAGYAATVGAVLATLG